MCAISRYIHTHSAYGEMVKNGNYHPSACASNASLRPCLHCSPFSHLGRSALPTLGLNSLPQIAPSGRGLWHRFHNASATSNGSVTHRPGPYLERGDRLLCGAWHNKRIMIEARSRTRSRYTLDDVGEDRSLWCNCTETHTVSFRVVLKTVCKCECIMRCRP